MNGKKPAANNNAKRFAVIFLDLDGFKVINDSLGHPVGDELLAAVAGRLRNCARPADVVARFGGDEFVILLDRIRDAEEALTLGNRMRSALATPFQIGSREVVSGASIGIVLSSPEIDNTDDLLRYADIAMYRAKSGGKGQVQLFNEGMRSYATKLCDLQNDLRQALARNQFVLHYQPTFSINSGKDSGRGSADSLAEVGERIRSAHRFYSAGGRNRTDFGNRRVGAAFGLRAERGLAAGGHSAGAHGRQSFAAPASGKRFPEEGAAHPGRDFAAPESAGIGADGNRVDG